MAGNNAVGSLAVLISANAVGFDKTVARVADDASNLHKRIKPTRAFDLGLGVGGFAAAGAGLLGVASAGGLVAKTLSTIQDQAHLGATARAMGLTAEQFTGIAAVARMAGEDTREFIESMVTLGKVAADGAAGTGQVAPDFFRQLNVDAKQFAALRADQQFFALFDALEKVQDPLARTRLLMVAFGEDGGKALLKALGKTTPELRAFAREAATSSAQMRDLEAAQQAVDRASAAWDRAWVRIAASVAPTVEAVAETLPGAIDRLIPKLEELKSVGDTKPGQAAKLTAAGFDLLRNGAARMSIGAGRVGQAAGHAINFVGDAAARERGSGVNDPWHDVPGKPPNWLQQFGGDLIDKSALLRQQGRDNLGSFLADDLRREMAAVDEARKEALRNRGKPGGPGGKPPGPPGLPEPSKEDLKRADDLARQAAKVRDQLATPADKWAAEQRDLGEHLKANRITAAEWLVGMRRGWREYAADALKAIDDPHRRWLETQRAMTEGVRNGAVTRDAARSELLRAFDDHARARLDAVGANGAMLGPVAEARVNAGLLAEQFRAGGMIGDRRELELRMGAIAGDLTKVFDRAEVRLPAALEKGTQEVESLLSKAVSGTQRQDPAKIVADAIKALERKQMTEEKLARELGKALATYLKITQTGG